MFDDHLDLAQADFSNCRMLVFTGPSGAGKSSYLNWLLEQHPDFAFRDLARIDLGRPLRWPPTSKLDAQLVVVDELLNANDLKHVARLVLAGHHVLTASHLPHWVHRFACPFGLRVYNLASDTQKIGNALRRQGYRFTEGDLARFKAQYGSSYTGLEQILAECPRDERDFGVALSHFNRYCTVRTIRETL
ncbi:MAG: hypothetical protein AAF737_07135 [Pseudomonadota bacterium]